MARSEGTKAPSFSVPTADDPESRVSLRDAEGFNLVLLFFPMAFTSVCTEEACQVSENLDQYRRLGAEVLGITVDSPFALAAWKEQEDFDLPLLSDFNREMINDYDIKRKELNGLKSVANRSAFVIDGDGVIRFSWESEDPGQLPPFDRIRETVESL